MIEAVEKDLNERFSEGDMSKVRIATAGSFRNPELAEDWRQEVAGPFRIMKWFTGIWDAVSNPIPGRRQWLPAFSGCFDIRISE